MIVVCFFFLSSLSKCYAQEDLTPNIETGHEDFVNIDKNLEPCLKITDLNKMMSNILDEMKDCLFSQELSVRHRYRGSISACRAQVEKSIKQRLKEQKPVLKYESQRHSPNKSIQELLYLEKPETEYHPAPEIDDQGEMQESFLY